MVIPRGTTRRASFHLQRRYLWGSREKGIREKCNPDVEVSAGSPLGEPQKELHSLPPGPSNGATLPRQLKMVPCKESYLKRFPWMHSPTLHHLMHAKKVCTPLCPRHALSLRLSRVLGARETWPLTAKNPTNPQGKDSHVSFTEQMHPRHAGISSSVSTHFNHAASVKSWFFTWRKKFYHAFFTSG